MEILEAYDLTGSYRAAAALAGCDHHTVARYVALREAGQSPVAREHRARPIDEYLPKVEELVVRSNGKIRADVVHRRITAMGFKGGERTTRRMVAQVKQRLREGQRRVFRPWIAEPGLWLQWDWGQGPVVGGRQTQLWCAWLAWSRFRVVIPVMDKTLPTGHRSAVVCVLLVGWFVIDVLAGLFVTEERQQQCGVAGEPFGVDSFDRQLAEQHAGGGVIGNPACGRGQTFIVLVG